MRVDELPSASTVSPVYRRTWHDGEKFPGGFGATDLLAMDYWALRARSEQLFRTNVYARGLLACIVDNEINTGLHLEATPRERMLGFKDEALADWAEDVETRFELWGKDPKSCDYVGRASFGVMQAMGKLESLIAGDILAVLLQDRRTLMPRLHLISGSAVRTPPQAMLGTLPGGNRVIHGVELDGDGRHVAFWVRKQPKGPFEQPRYERLPAISPSNGRRVAWLVYGMDRRVDDVRGEPMLSIVLQSLREIDRYRDAVQRKAVINSIIAILVTKTQDKMGTQPVGRTAMRKGSESVIDQGGATRSLPFADIGPPGVIIDELAPGEEPKGFIPHGTDEKFGDFEEAMVQAIAWCYRIPPEIVRLSFSSNYSASQAAVNEYKMHLNRVRATWGEGFCHPVYEEWLLSSVLGQKVQARGLLKAWRDPLAREVLCAWTSSDWSGHIKPAVDMSKLVKGYRELLDMGLITYARAARELTGTRFTHNIKQQQLEVLQLIEAREPLSKLEQKSSAPATPPPREDADDPDRVDDEDDDNAEAA